MTRGFSFTLIHIEACIEYVSDLVHVFFCNHVCMCQLDLGTKDNPDLVFIWLDQVHWLIKFYYVRKSSCHSKFSLPSSMAAITTTTATLLVKQICLPTPSPSPLSIRICCKFLSTVPPPLRFVSRPISYAPIRCATASGSDGGNKKASARLSQVQQQLHEAMERAAGGDEPIPKITLDHVTVSFARSGGPGGQNVNKVNTKVDMRFNVNAADWLSERVREKILQMEKNRINKDGELVISSTRTRTQKGNIEDALEKLQAIIDAASYVPPPPSEEQVKKITKIAAVAEQKRLQNKKVLSQKKAFRRSRDSYD
ncbi:hypothetical protein L6452_16139 [Arctium lappa]|uniref:Uncharacterized protein n=1 Tax=Arctium lappa TaxID=4217 RepID=A0ACB9BZW4_ARCLA|nr:hypothetical protein L6452_16139 [Arctium lappa]